jgi:glyoxylase-like metal-dependent hydrolase (beta-lactamase superfamily II)
MRNLQVFTFNDFAENTYVLYNESGLGIIIDPGCYYREEQQELDDFIRENQLTITQVLNTHCHVDHVLGNYYTTDRYKVPLFIPKGEEVVLKSVKAYAPNYGFHQYHGVEPKGFLTEQTRLVLGEEVIQILSVPGHSPDHVAFYLEKEKMIIGGDVLFRESIGRTDLPGGHHETLIRSIHTKLFVLSDDVVVYPGHGPETTIGYEKKFNPFCALK